MRDINEQLQTPFRSIASRAWWLFISGITPHPRRPPTCKASPSSGLSLGMLCSDGFFSGLLASYKLWPRNDLLLDLDEHAGQLLFQDSRPRWHLPWIPPSFSSLLSFSCSSGNRCVFLTKVLVGKASPVFPDIVAHPLLFPPQLCLEACRQIRAAFATAVIDNTRLHLQGGCARSSWCSQRGGSA